MATPRTARTNASVDAFIAAVEDDAVRRDCETLMGMMERATGARPALWGSSIVGFGSYHYRYESGREGEWFLTGFAPRKRNLTLYVMAGFDRYAPLMAKLGKHSTGKACLYVKRLADVDLAVLEELVSASVEHMKRRHPSG